MARKSKVNYWSSRGCYASGWGEGGVKKGRVDDCCPQVHSWTLTGRTSAR
jgi:hypothetical protein